MIDLSSQTTIPGKVKVITESLENGIKDLFSSEKYAFYLTAISKFYNYSFNNTILIAMQKPDATYVAGLQKWNKEFHRYVNKGEKGILILAPSPYKKEIESTVIDENGNPKIDENGNAVKERKTVEFQSFRPAYVYDISQTHGEPMPSIGVNELNGGVDNYEKIINTIKDIAPVNVTFEKIETGAKGYYSQIDKKIVINEGMSELQTLKTLIHETAHAMLHDNDFLKSTGEEKDRQTKEVEAESVAYTVCSYLGLPTSDYSFGYIAGWSGARQMDAVKESLETIKQCSTGIIADIEKRLIPEKELQLAYKMEQQTKHKSIAI